jgi:uncharacterized membrane protein
MHLSIWHRFLIYGCAGCCFEIVFTGVKHLIASGFKDWSMRGKSYIWMFPIYGLLAFLFEPAHDRIRPLAWPVRGLIYVTGFYVVEFTTGWLLRVITGRCPWDYSETRYHFKGLVRWDYAPIWFGFCLAIEPLHDLLLRVQI